MRDTVFPILGLLSTGDQIQDRALIEAGGKGLFTKEIDEALLERRAAFAVHSMKDVQTELPDDIELGAILEREDARDMLLARGGETRLADLPQGVVIGTASLRRQAQALYQRPDLSVVVLRGNVDTRLGRLASGAIYATFLARAGLNRLGRKEAQAEPLALSEMLPAAAQGRTPIAAHVNIESMDFTGEVLTPDGQVRWRKQMRFDMKTATRTSAIAAGQSLGQAVRDAAGDQLAAALANA